jgi:hypothetical protein
MIFGWLFGGWGNHNPSPRRTNANSFLPNDGGSPTEGKTIPIIVYDDGGFTVSTWDEVYDAVDKGTLRFGWTHRRMIVNNEPVLAKVYHPC